MPQLTHGDDVRPNLITSNQSQEALELSGGNTRHDCSNLEEVLASKSVKLQVLATIPSMLHSIVLPEYSASAPGATVDSVWKHAIDETMHMIHTLKDVLKGLSSSALLSNQHVSDVDVDPEAALYSRHQNTDCGNLYMAINARPPNPLQSSVYRTVSTYKTLYHPLHKSTMFLAVACYTQILQILIHLGVILRDAAVSGNKPLVQLLDVQTTSMKSRLSPSLQTVFIAHLIKESVSELSTHTSQLLQATGRSLLTTDDVNTKHHDMSVQGMENEIRQLEFDLHEALSAAINASECIVA